MSQDCIHCTSNPPWKEQNKKTEGGADNHEDGDGHDGHNVDGDDDDDDGNDDDDDYDAKQWPLYPLSRL